MVSSISRINTFVLRQPSSLVQADIMEWDQAKCLDLIQAYRNARCLWDPSYDHYKNVIRKRNSWQEIANRHQCSVDEVKKKMDSLLASYRRERQKSLYKKAGSGANYKYISKWFAFKSFRFLMGNYKPRKNFGAAKNTITFDTTDQDNDPNEEELPEMESNDSTKTESTIYYHNDNTGIWEPSVPESTPSKKSRNEEPRVSESYNNTLKETFYPEPADKSTAFGNFVASKHREYSKRTRAIVEHRISNILFEADMGEYDRSQNTFSEGDQTHTVNIIQVSPSQKTTGTANTTSQNSSSFISPNRIASVSRTLSTAQPSSSPDQQILLNNIKTEDD